jgi:hypothetical protein
MIGLLCFVLAVLALPFRSKLRLEAENAVLRHQLIVGSAAESSSGSTSQQTADVIMPSPRPRIVSEVRPQEKKNAPIAATMVAIIAGTNSRRSSLAGIRLALHRYRGPSSRESVSK